MTYGCDRTAVSNLTFELDKCLPAGYILKIHSDSKFSNQNKNNVILASVQPGQSAQQEAIASHAQADEERRAAQPEEQGSRGSDKTYPPISLWKG